jgi:two-component system, NtrC family, response regulator AtoC
MKNDRALKILLVDDEEIVHLTITPYLRDLGNMVDVAYESAGALKLLEQNDYDLALFDVQMPGIDGLALLGKLQELRPELSAVIISGHGSMEMAIQALRLGAADFLAKPIKLLELDAVLEKAARLRELRQGQRRLRDTIRGIQSAEDQRERNRQLVGQSPATEEVRGQIRMAVEAKCDTILILGETGTGKEVVAREIHFLAGPDDSPIIAVSCPAIPENLVESELFGHMKGSFTGAIADKAGDFELADGGTLFLDEIGDLSAGAQAKLLRVLETRTLRRVGGAEEIKVNLRLVAATNVSLQERVKAGKFREDLFYRLNLFTIQLRPLRERREDIIPLAEHFLNTYAGRKGLAVPVLSPKAQELLLNYDYPGNVRELRNLIERAAILCWNVGRIEPEHLGLPVAGAAAPATGGPADQDPERARIVKALEQAKWNRREAAQILNMPYSTLRYKMKALNIA